MIRKFIVKLGKQNQVAAGALGVFLVLFMGLILQGHSTAAREGVTRQPHLNKLARTLARASYDWYFDLELVKPPNVQTSQVVLIYMDEESYKVLDQPLNQPWDRKKHAELLRILKAAGAKGVMFDIIFGDKGPSAEADEAFAEAIREQPNVVLAEDRSRVSHANDRIGLIKLTLPYQPFREAAAGWGLDHMQADEDFIVRRHFHGEQESDSSWSMTWKMANLVSKKGIQDPAERMKERWVRYYGGPETIPNVSYRQALIINGVPSDFFKNKIVIIGARPITTSFIEKRDELRSPYSAKDRERDFLFMPAVEVHATILLNLLQNDWLTRLSPAAERGIFFLVALLFGYGFCRFKPWVASVLTLVGIGAFTLLALILFSAKNIWFPWLIVVAVQLPTALAWAVLARSIEWFVQKRRMQAERRIAETQIQEQAALLDKAQDAIFVLGLDASVTYWNKSAEKLFGWAREEVLQRCMKEEFLGLEWVTLQQVCEGAYEKKEWHGELQLVTKSSRVITVESRWTLVRDDSEQAKSFLVINTDVTEKRKAQMRIQEQAALLDKAQDAILVQDLKGNSTYWNKSAERLYGWRQAEVIGSQSPGIFTEMDPKIQAARKNTLARGEWHGELEQKTKEGTEIIVESRWTLVRDDQGNPRSILILNADITEKKKLEQQFLRTQRMESIGTLAGGIAHDLNNVLSPIMLGVELLQLKMSDEASRKTLGPIETSAKRGRDMVKQVLTFARGHEGEKSVLQLSHLVKEMEKIVKETFPKQIQIHVNGGKDLRPLLGDATQLHQILLNLCVNARDAMPDGGEIFIETSNVTLTDAEIKRLGTDALGSEPPPPEASRDYVLLSVRDTGTGIPPEIIHKIFEPFFTTKEIGKGTGLGLSTVVSIVKNHHGFLELISKMRSGTTFNIYLPAQEMTASIGNETVDRNGFMGQDELVLVVDDEPPLREMIQATLTSSGYRVLLAANGSEAIRVCAESKEKIALVLIDMMMPVMGGATAIRMLQRQHPHLKFIAMSGLLQPEKLQEQLAGRGVEVLAKPFDSDKLLGVLRKLLHDSIAPNA